MIYFLFEGLSGDENDLSTRKDAFGRNEIPPNPPKSFFYLMLNALQNVGIIKILVFAIILFVLSFYSQNGETFEDEASPSKFIIKT